MLALGADWCNAARGFMFALGCIQSQTCHTGRCPTGVATQDAWPPARARGADKAERVANFHRATVAALMELVAAAGLERPSQLQGYHFSRRISQNLTATFAELYPELQPRELITGMADPRFAKAWVAARSDRFSPVL